jgi:hypothetical protein
MALSLKEWRKWIWTDNSFQRATLMYEVGMIFYCKDGSIVVDIGNGEYVRSVYDPLAKEWNEQDPEQNPPLY